MTVSFVICTFFLGKNEKTTLGKDEETPSSCSRFRHQRLRNSRYILQILDTRMGLHIIIVLPATCLVEKLSCTHMINRMYHHITHACMILVPKICNIHNSASLVVVCKSWTLVRIPSSLPQHGDRKHDITIGSCITALKSGFL